MASQILSQHTNDREGSFRFGCLDPCSIHIHLLEASNLNANDSSKLIDPYFVLSVKGSDDKKPEKTPISIQTLDPVPNWQCTINLKDSKCDGELKIQIYHHTSSIFRDTLLGKVKIPLIDLQTNGIITGWYWIQAPQKDKKAPPVRTNGRIFIRIIGDLYTPRSNMEQQIFLDRRAQLLDLVRLLEVEYTQLLQKEIRRLIDRLDAERRKKEREERKALQLQRAQLLLEQGPTLNSQDRQKTLNSLIAESEEAQAEVPNRDVSGRFSLTTILRQKPMEQILSPGEVSSPISISRRSSQSVSTQVTSQFRPSTSNNTTPTSATTSLNATIFSNHNNNTPPTTTNNLTNTKTATTTNNNNNNNPVLLDYGQDDSFYQTAQGPLLIDLPRSRTNSASQNGPNNNIHNDNTPSRSRNNSHSDIDLNNLPPTSTNFQSFFSTQPPTNNTSLNTNNNSTNSNQASISLQFPIANPDTPTSQQRPTPNLTPSSSPLQSPLSDSNTLSTLTSTTTLSLSVPSSPNRTTTTLDVSKVNTKMLAVMHEGQEGEENDDDTIPIYEQPKHIIDATEGRRNIIYLPPKDEIPYLPLLPIPPYVSTSPQFICSPLQHPPLSAVPIEYTSSQPQGGLPTRSEAIFSPTAITQDDSQLPLIGYQVKLCVGSWNVGNAPPSEPELLRDWLRDDCDIYVIGTQENHYSPRKQYKTHSEDFNSAMLTALGSQYELVQQQDMGQIHIHLFVKIKIRKYIDLLQPTNAKVATGLLGTLPNKGGVALGFNLFGNSFVFVNSHLAAHTHKKEKRDEDMRSIVRGLGFNGAYNGASILLGFHHVFWMGDLNYRLRYAGDGQKPDPAKFDEILVKIDNNEYDELLLTDQLLFDTLEQKKAFVGFNDSVIDFAPTFKVKKGKPNQYDPARTPSYCDRVLWRSQAGFEKQVLFSGNKGIQSVTSSDHKPISAVFHLFPSLPVPAISNRIEHVHFALTSLTLTDITTANGNLPDKNTSLTPSVRIASTLLSTTVQTSTKKGEPGLSEFTWTREEGLPTLKFNASSEGRLWESLITFNIFDMNKLSSTLLCAGSLSFKTEDIISFLHDDAYSQNARPCFALGPKVPLLLQAGIGSSMTNSTSTLPNATSLSRLPSLSPMSSLSMSSSRPSLLQQKTISSPETPTLRLVKTENGLELELDRTLQLYTPNGKEGGLIRITGLIHLQKKPRLQEYVHDDHVAE